MIMKTMKNVLAVIALVASASTAFATNKDQTYVSLVSIADKKVAVSVQTEENEIYRLKLKDEHGQILHESKTDKSGKFQKVFDLAKLEDGNYVISVNNADLKAERQFSISNGSIIVGDFHYAAAPVFTYRDNVLRVAYLNYENEPVTITVYNESDNVVYSKEINKNFAVNEGIDFKKVHRGNYQVIFGNDNNNYSYSIEK